MKVYSIRSYIEALSDAKLLVTSKIVNDTLAIEHITYNSKETKPYTLFACKGAAFKKDYLDEAVDNNIACYMSEKIYDTNVPVSFIIVSDIRKAMALVADMCYDSAYKKLKLIGITGTKGKSTTAYYIKYIVDEYMQSLRQKPCGIISSIDTYDGKIMEESHLTTPEAFELHKHFDNAISSGLEYMIMEVSSQALKYDRVLGIDFDSGIFLNISQDHISPIEHSDFDDYFNSKLKLFNQTKTAFVNLDSDHANVLLDCAKSSQEIITFSINKTADVYGYNIKKVGNETHFNVRTNKFDEEFILTMPGLFNVENALAAIAVCVKYDIPVEIIKLGLLKARSSGRMEIFSSQDNSVVVLVDYAHNKLSFEKLYQSTQEEFKGRDIITVFGCPGGKAYNRREELGKLASEYSNKVYLTMEDPNYEAVSDISNDIKKNIINENCECYLIDDRGEAIKNAIKNAKPNSIILITGKGNETSHKIDGKYIPYKTDIEYAQTYLKEVVKKDRL